MRRLSYGAIKECCEFFGHLTHISSIEKKGKAMHLGYALRGEGELEEI